MSAELLLFVLMVGTFVIGCFVAKLPVSLSMVLASVAGTLASGNGIPIRHLVEGTFGYLDTILVIATATIFMRVIQEIGTLDALTAVILRRFHGMPALLLIFLMLVAMFPGMITGSSSAAVLTAGAIIAPVLALIGIPRVTAGAFIAMAGILGMIAPPVNIPAMIIGGGIDMPYVGFEIPLLLLTLPLAVFSALFLGLPHARRLDLEQVRGAIDAELLRSYGWRLYLPVLLVVALMVAGKVFPGPMNPGLPLIFVLGSLVGLVSGRRIQVVATAREAVRTALPVLGILAGVGMFIQVMTLTGVRGFIVVNSLSLPPALLYASIAITIPLFGAVSAFGSASVLGVPFLLALLGKDQIITAAALSLVSSLGDLMPPTALSAIFAAQVVGEDPYWPVLRRTVIPALVVVAWALLFILFSKEIRGLLPR